MAEEKITIYPNIDEALKSVKDNRSSIQQLEEELKTHYFVFICVDNDTDHVFTPECRSKTIKWYQKKIQKHIESHNKLFKDSGFDLVIPYVTEEFNLAAQNKKIVSTRVSCAVYKLENKMFSPSPYYMYARSSIYKTPFMLANGVGIIDSGYRGNLGIALYNHTQQSEEVKSGTRITQICMPDLSTNFHVLLVNKLDDTERGQGGFGSTGN